MTDDGDLGRSGAGRRGGGRPARGSAGLPAIPGTAEDRMAELESRLSRLERAPGLRDRGRTMVDRVMPPEAGQHFRNAGREHLLGVRSIVDHWIRRIDAADSRAGGAGSSSPDRESIEIE